VGQREGEQPEEPKGFIQEAFEHRQRGVNRAGPDDEVHDLVDPTEVTTVDPTALDDSSEDATDVALDAAEPEDAVDPVVELPPEPLAAADQALVDEALKKSGLIWIRTPDSPAGQAVWHSWLDGAIYLVTGGEEQPDPGLLDVGVARSKETTSRLVTFAAAVEPLRPEAPDWVPAVADLAKTRLNLHDGENVPDRWATDARYRLYRLSPVGPLLEGPGAYPTESHRAAPVPTGATTAGPKPKILHRRHGSGSALS
jgi:hypothetical protein